MDAYVAAADASSSSNSVLVATCSKALISFTLDHAHTLYTCTGDAVLSESELLFTTQDDIDTYRLFGPCGVMDKGKETVRVFRSAPAT